MESRPALEFSPETQVPPPAAAESRRAAANRENAQHSTGPRSAAGKAASSQNSFQHGLYSKALICPGEDPAQLDALKADLRREHQPANTTEAILVNDMAEHFWRIRRWRERENRLMCQEDPDLCLRALVGFMPVIQRLMSASERGFHKALTALRQLQKDRGFVPQNSENAPDMQEVTSPASAEIGFVPQSDTPPHPAPRRYSDAVEARLAKFVADGSIEADDYEMRDMMAPDLEELERLNASRNSALRNSALRNSAR